MPSLDAYLAGSLSLVVIAAALGFGGYNLRRWIAPQFSGALARLAELVLGIALLVLTLQLLGTVGLLRAGWIPAACAVAGIGAGLLGRARAPASASARPGPPPRTPRFALVIVLGVAAWTFADWSVPAQVALDEGMFGGDSVWYHMPSAARFAQDHSIVSLHFSDPLRFAVWFYPQSYELLDGGSIAMFRSDVLAPLMNLGWLGVGFLAAWCIGRPYGVAPATLVAAALVFDSGLMWETQAGEARNDMMALALLLAFVAFAVNARQIGPSGGLSIREGGGPAIGAGPLIVAGLAAGLAISTKLTMLLPVGVIALGVVLVHDPRARRRTLLALGGALFVTGAYWYGRNVIQSGNPLPLVRGIGPLELPHPDQMSIYPRPPHSVASYLFEPAVYRQYFFPQLENALGPLWPLLLATGLASAVYALRRADDAVLRVLAAAALLTAVLYVFVPIGASGPENQPRGFFTNTRYLVPALLLGLMLLPLARSLRESERRRAQVLALLAVVFAVTALTTLAWPPAYIGGALFITAIACCPLAIWWLRARRGLNLAGLTAIALGVVALTIALGRSEQVHYVETRYTNPEPFYRQAGPVEAFEWARDVRDRRIGMVGAGQVFFTQYGWYGSDLSNSVQYVGVNGPNGAFTLPRTCQQLRRRINAGSYDYLVTTEYGTVDERMWDFPVSEWLRDDPALKKILAENVTPQRNWVYRVDGELDPAGCDADPPVALAGRLGADRG